MRASQWTAAMASREAMGTKRGHVQLGMLKGHHVIKSGHWKWDQATCLAMWY